MNRSRNRREAKKLKKRNQKLLLFIYLSLGGSKAEMAEKEVKEEEEEEKEEKNDLKKILSAYLGLSFSVWLALVGPGSVSLRLSQAEEQLRQMRSRRKEDSKANARVVEIFASRRDSWRAEERRLLEGMEEMRERVAELEKREELYKARLQDLEREVAHRDDIISFMSNSTSTSTSTSTRIDQDSDCACSSATANAGLDSISKYWAETPTHCQVLLSFCEFVLGLFVVYDNV